MRKHQLNIDLETYSSVDLGAAGLWRYIESPDFEILLFAYSLDGQPVEVIDLAQGEVIPDWIIEALRDDGYTKRAYNATFEFGCLDKVYGGLNPSQWRCTMFHGLYAGYTKGLEATGKALGLEDDKQKLTTGKALIRYFCVPCKPTKANGGRTRNLPKHDPDKWALFKEYNRQDVVAEREIEARLAHYVVPKFLQEQWETDLMINRRGVAVDMEFVSGALKIDTEVREALTNEAIKLTGMSNPNSVAQLKDWLAYKDKVQADDLRKDTVSKLIDSNDLSDKSKRVLAIRQELGKTSTKKYRAIETCVCDDSRVRGLLMFYGANRTGRYAGRLVQVQNLPRTYTIAIDNARSLVKSGDTKGLKLVYGNVPDTLSQLIRTAFVASKGNVLIDADFSAIEARVLSWLAGEEWRLKAFEDGEDIYCATASRMFGVPVKKHGENGHLRQKGKISELALGYQGSTGALITMGALDMGLKEEELPDIVKKWREANPRIVQFWYDLDEALRTVVTSGGWESVGKVKLALEYDDVNKRRVLSIFLPSGRKLYYIEPEMGLNRFGSPSVTYAGVDQTNGRWVRLDTYGGKICENITQAVSRDILAEAIERLEAAGFPIVFHVHDEVVIDRKRYGTDEKMLADVVELMSKLPKWADGIPLTADGWVGDYFTKD